MKEISTPKYAIRFIIFFGAVSLFADATYEGARSITGPFLEVLGAEAATVGLVVGLGELIGYGLRMGTGWLADRTGRYWLFIFLGYSVNVLIVPFIGLAQSWQLAAIFIVTERLGKAIRTPARDAILSQATSQIGHGKGFGMHEALDQIGAVVGPLIISGIFFWKENYALGFGVLSIPALISLSILYAAYRRFPMQPVIKDEKSDDRRFIQKRSFVWYLVGIGFVALGFADFPLLAFHFKHTNLFTDQWIPIIYAIAMGVDALAGLGLGILFDRWKRIILVSGILVTSIFAPLVFLGHRAIAILGVIVWGIGMGLIESVLRASVASLIPSSRRGWAYGLFNGVFGFAWFAGSALTGWLYDINIGGMILFLIFTQLCAIPFLWLAFARA